MTLTDPARLIATVPDPPPLAAMLDTSSFERAVTASPLSSFAPAEATFVVSMSVSMLRFAVSDESTS